MDYDRVISEYRARVLPKQASESRAQRLLKPASETRAERLLKPASEPPIQRLPRLVPDAARGLSAPEQSFDSLEQSVENGGTSHPAEVETEGGVEDEDEAEESGSDELEELRPISKTSKVRGVDSGFGKFCRTPTR